MVVTKFKYVYILKLVQLGDTDYYWDTVPISGHPIQNDRAFWHMIAISYVFHLYLWQKLLYLFFWYKSNCVILVIYVDETWTQTLLFYRVHKGILYTGRCTHDFEITQTSCKIYNNAPIGQVYFICCSCVNFTMFRLSLLRYCSG